MGINNNNINKNINFDIYLKKIGIFQVFHFFEAQCCLSGEEYLYDGTKDEEKKKLWARARCGNIWLGQDSRGGEMCRGCGQEKENAQHPENCKEFEKRTGIKKERWWMD